MLYLIYGGDSISRKTKYQKIVDDAAKGGSIFVSMNDTDFNFDFLKISSSGTNLFSDKYVVLLNSVFSNKDLNTDLIFEMLGGLAKSDNVFIWSEPTITKDALKKFEKNDAKVVDCGTLTKKGSARFNTFALTDALGARDKKMSWIIFEQALEHDIAPEEINGVLFWMVKGMILSHKDSGLSASETGLSPFVYQKAKNSSTKFSMIELKQMARSLVSLYHEAHRGETDFEIGIEQFLLKSL